jgi:hypothetical protein
MISQSCVLGERMHPKDVADRQKSTRAGGLKANPSLICLIWGSWGRRAASAANGADGGGDFELLGACDKGEAAWRTRRLGRVAEIATKWQAGEDIDIEIKVSGTAHLG